MNARFARKYPESIGGNDLAGSNPARPANSPLIPVISPTGNRHTPRTAVPRPRETRQPALDDPGPRRRERPQPRSATPGKLDASMRSGSAAAGTPIPIRQQRGIAMDARTDIVEVAALLVAARTVVADPARWCPYPHALDANGHRCEGRANNAVCWGAAGALDRAAADAEAAEHDIAEAHRQLIGIGGHLTMPPLPHHRAYGSVPRRFDRIRPQRGCRVWGGRASRNGGCVGPAGPPHVRPCASTPSASQRRWRLGPLRVPGGGAP